MLAGLRALAACEHTVERRRMTSRPRRNLMITHELCGGYQLHEPPKEVETRSGRRRFLGALLVQFPSQRFTIAPPTVKRERNVPKGCQKTIQKSSYCSVSSLNSDSATSFTLELIRSATGLCGSRERLIPCCPDGVESQFASRVTAFPLVAS